MLNPEYDVAVAYRIYPKPPKIPAVVYPLDKLRMSEVCLKSFKDSLGSLRVKILVILDGCDKSYEKLFTDLFNEEDLIIKHVNKIGNYATFDLQLEWLKNQDYSEWIYFAEDDYIYTPNGFSDILSFAKSKNSQPNFISPYDHPDYGSLLWHTFGETPTIIETNNRRWTSRASTTCTFLTSRKLLREVSAILEMYPRLGDIGFWALLTKRNVIDPRFLAYLAITQKERWLIRYFIKALLYGWRHIVSSHKYTLWAPTPSLATHAETDFLAKGVDWEGVIQSIVLK